MSRREPDLETGMKRGTPNEKGSSSITVSENENPYFAHTNFELNGSYLDDLRGAIKNLEEIYNKSLDGQDHQNGHGYNVAGRPKKNLFSKLKRRKPPIRYAVYIAPLILLLAIPLAILSTVSYNQVSLPGLPPQTTWPNGTAIESPPPSPPIHAAGLLVWLEIVAVALWVALSLSWLSISSFSWGCELLKEKLRTRQLLFDALKDISTDLMALPVTLILWTIISFATTSTICVFDEGHCGQDVPWIYTVSRVFEAGIVVSFILWAERFLIGVSFISYYGKQYDWKHEVLQSDISQIRNLFYLTLHRPPKHTHKLHHPVVQTCQDCKKAPSAHGCLSAWKDDWNDVFKCAIRKEDAAVHLATYLWYAIKLDYTDLSMAETDEHAKKLLDEQDIYNGDLKDWVCDDRENFPDAIKQRIYPYPDDEDGNNKLVQGFLDILNGDNDSDITIDEMKTAITRLGKRAETLEKTLHNVREAMESLDRPLSVVVLIAVAFVYAAFFVTNFNTYATAIFTAFTGLGFALSGTVTDFLTSCIFLFVKHPYYVGDRIEINHVQLYVDRIALMTTRFARADNGKFVQLPHSLLNTYWIENLSRSKVLKEYFTIAVSPDTSLKTIEDIEKDLEHFVFRNKRDFKEDTVRISLSAINDLTQLKLDVEVEHKFKYFDDDVHSDRQIRFKQALLTFIRDKEVLPPNVDPVQIGDPWRPTYTLNSNPEEFTRSKSKFDEDQAELKRRRKKEADEYRKRPTQERSQPATPMLGPHMTPRSTGLSRQNT